MCLLLCATLAYIPLKGFKKSTYLNDLCAQVAKSKINIKNQMANETRELCKLLKNSIRYKDMKFRNFINIVDENTQFGAMTITIKNIKVISFKGSDGSIIGWIENFRQEYKYPTYTQEMAIKYLNDNVTFLDTCVYVTGHSKGGNLAMVSVMESPNSKFKKIKQVINFDGPGFRKKEYKSSKYKKLKEKLINIIPTHSYIGVLMFNDDYKVITSKSHTMSLHFPQTWNTYGNILIEGKLSNLSKKINNITSHLFSELDQVEVESVIETAISELLEKKSYDDRFFTADLKSMMNSIKSIDSETAKRMYSLLSSIASLNNSNKK